MKSYLQLHTLLLGRIKTLLSEKTFYSREEYRKILSPVILDFFPLLKWLTEVVGSKEDIEGLFVKFKRLYKVGEQEALRDVEYSPHQMEDFDDEINYLKICVENTCNVDLDNVNFALPKRTGEEEIELSTFEKFRRSQSNYEYTMESILGNIDDSLTTTAKLKNLFIHARIREKIHNKIMSGEVYIYKTKPKRNLVMKAVLIVLWYAALIFSSFAFWNNFNGSASGSITPFHNSLLFLVTSIFVLLSAANFLHLFCNMKNDNLRYHFCGRSLSTFLSIFLVLFSILYFLGYLFLPNGLVFFTDDAAKKIWIGVFSTTASAIVLHIVSCMFMQLEEDREIMEEFLKDYVSDSSDSLPQDL